MTNPIPTEVKLTDDQLDVLRLYEHTSDTNYLQGVKGASDLWFKHKLLDWHGAQYGTDFYSITEAGRRALSGDKP